MDNPFYVKDCARICRMAGVHAAVSLRELRARIEVCPTASLYHHFCETKLRPSFDDPVYQNDFALWAARSLRDQSLAERLGVINPYDYADLDDLRNELVDLIDDHLAEIPTNPQALRGDNFHFMQAMTVVFDTKVKVETLPGLLPAVSRMTPGSIYFHIIEARRRTSDGRDDFSTWLRPLGGTANEIADVISQSDFYFLSLREIQERMVALLQAQFPTSVTV
jgi:hypothetical protein